MLDTETALGLKLKGDRSSTLTSNIFKT